MRHASSNHQGRTLSCIEKTGAMSNSAAAPPEHVSCVYRQHKPQLGSLVRQRTHFETSVMRGRLTLSSGPRSSLGASMMNLRLPACSQATHLQAQHRPEAACKHRSGSRSGLQLQGMTP